MPWISTAASIGGKVVSGLFGRSAAKKAAKQAEAAKAEAGGINQGVFDTAKGIYSPYADQGPNALAALASQVKDIQGRAPGAPRPTFQGPSRAAPVYRAPTAESVMATPGYQFGMDEGRSAIEGSAAARGGLYSGANLKALNKFGTDYATTKFGQAYDRAGQDFDRDSRDFAQNYGRSQDAYGRDLDAFNTDYDRQRTRDNDQTSRLGTLANFGMQGANALNQAGETFAGRQSNIITGNAVAQGNSQIAQGNAFQNMANGVTSSLADYLKKPSVQKVPGYTDGAPRADDVLSRLSSEEHVLDVPTVRMVGRGNLDKGHNLLTRLRMKAKGK